MKLTKLISVVAAASICLSLTGCKELPMDSYKALSAEPQTVIVGETLTLAIPLPTEKAKGTAAVVYDSTAAPITADYEAPSLKISGVAAGTASVQIEFSAGWLYKKSSLTIPIVCELPQLEASIECDTLPITLEGAQPPEPASKKTAAIKVDMGSTATLTVVSPEQDITITAQPAATETVKLVADGLSLAINPLKPGKASIDLIASKEGFRDTVITCQLEVVAVPTPLALSGDTGEAVKITKGHASAVQLEYEGELAAVSDSSNVHVTIKDGQLVLTAVAEGTANVTVTAKKEGYLDNSLSLACTVTAAAPPPAPAAPTGEYASVISDILKYTNSERASMGLPALKLSSALSGAAAIRAKETATDQSHTRPDGRRGLTAIQDAGLGSYDAEGENLSGSSDAEDGEAIVARWMASPAHRDAILFPQFKTLGVGVYYDGDMYRYCQLFTGSKL